VNRYIRVVESMRGINLLGIVFILIFANVWHVSAVTNHALIILEPVSYAKVTVLVDNNPFKEGMSTAWGISMYVETSSDELLFDAGPDPKLLTKNAEKLGVSLEDLNAVFISHGHGDHVGGLEALVGKKLTVYIPTDKALAEYVRSLRFKVIVLNETTVISRGFISTGPMYGPPYEQALGIYVKDLGLIVLTGCSHPGVENIVRYLHNVTGLKIYAVIGGFHLIGANERRLEEVKKVFEELNVTKVYPIHCTGDSARKYFKEELGNRYGDGGVGLELEFTAHNSSMIKG